MNALIILGRRILAERYFAANLIPKCLCHFHIGSKLSTIGRNMPLTKVLGRRTMSRTLNPPETIEVDDLTISCDGGGGILGHPKVFLTLHNGEVECPYCDCQFVLKNRPTS